jgi:adenine/guanine/hypoxanthine permease
MSNVRARAAYAGNGGMSNRQSVRASWHEELLAGTALFCCLYYVVSINAKVLGEMDIPPSAAIAATFLSLIFGNLSGAIWTRTGLMIAPAIGISTFVANFVQTVSSNSPAIFGVGDAMLACAFAGVALVLTSWKTDLRSRVIDEMPDAVRRGVIAAIGALLVYEAFKQYSEITRPQGYVNQLLGIFVIAIGLAVLIGFFLVRHAFSVAGHGVWTNIVRFGLRIEFVLVIALSSVVLHLFEPSYINSLPLKTELSWIWLSPGVWSSFHFAPGALCGWIVVAMVVWFIVLTDIPGTPNVVLPPTYQAANRDRAVRGGFINDSVAALLTPFLGTTPTIYYAENQILKEFGCYGRLVGLTAVFWFSLVFIIIGSSTWWGFPPVSLERLLPPFAVLPALLYIGLLLISLSFFSPTVQPGQSAKKKSIGSYVPVAISVLSTPIIGLEFAFPLTVISYWIITGMRRGRDTPEHGGSFVWITWGAGVQLVIMLLIRTVLRHI